MRTPYKLIRFLSGKRFSGGKDRCTTHTVYNADYGKGLKKDADHYIKMSIKDYDLLELEIAGQLKFNQTG